MISPMSYNNYIFDKHGTNYYRIQSIGKRRVTNGLLLFNNLTVDVVCQSKQCSI